jgi:hypothetical protein
MAGGAEEVSAGIGTGCPLALASACNFDRTSAKVMDRSVFAPLTGFLGLTGSTTVASVSGVSTQMYWLLVRANVVPGWQSGSCCTLGLMDGGIVVAGVLGGMAGS